MLRRQIKIETSIFGNEEK